ncbi:MAG TPA: single-stranded DNA-binding protein [Ensifer sp.]|nr:single-stranded DNA-binding protein [Ensifer sp.]
MMQASAYGRIGQDPRSVTTSNGTAMATTSIAINIGDHDSPPVWWGIVAFGRNAEELLRHKKGDNVSVSGRVQQNTWTSPSGEKREQMQIVADCVVSARTVRPGNGSHKASLKTHDRASA